MEDLKIKNDKLVDEVLHLVDIIEEKDKKIEYLEKYIWKTCFYVIKKKLQYKNPTGKFVYHNIIYYFFVTSVPLFISRAG